MSKKYYYLKDLPYRVCMEEKSNKDFHIMSGWVWNNMKLNEWTECWIHGGIYYFKNIEDAVAFKLRWL